MSGKEKMFKTWILKNLNYKNMIRVGIAGFGKIGQIRAYELEKNENS